MYLNVSSVAHEWDSQKDVIDRSKMHLVTVFIHVLILDSLSHNMLANGLFCCPCRQHYAIPP